MFTRDTDKKLFLLDAFALIFRAYYALMKTPRFNSKGMNTSAILGFSNTLFDILTHEKPSHIAVAFDAPAQTLREIDYAAYKANRSETPEDILVATPWIKKIIEALHIPILEYPGYEADDVIGTLSKKAEQAGFITYMMTSDKDYGQLVSDRTFIFKPGIRGSDPEVLGIEQVLKKFDIERIDQVVDLLGMMGDAVDNIPGIPGIGEKTASKLLREFGSLESLLENADQLKGKQKENVVTFRDQAILSKKLATILLDIPIDFNEQKLRLNEPDRDRLREIFSELEFRQLAERVLVPVRRITPVKAAQGELFGRDDFESVATEENEHSTGLKNIHTVTHRYELIQTHEDVQRLIKTLLAASAFSFDTETSEKDAVNAFLVGMSFAVQPHQAWYVAVSHDREEGKKQLQLFREIFEDETKLLIGQNHKFDYKVLKKYGIEIKNKIFDTMIAHYLINPDVRHNMDYLSEVYLGYSPVSIETLIGKKGKNQGTMADLTPEEISEYAAEDADVTLQLKEKFEPKVSSGEIKKIFEEIEIPLVRVLGDMELEGVRVDEPFLKNYGSELEKDILKIKTEIHALSGEVFNIDSPKQLGIILFEKLKITDQVKKTKTGQYSTGEEILAAFLRHHPIIPKILDYRELRKLKSTYADGLPAMINPSTGRIHTNYMQTVVATGRLSSNNPNLQNIPIRTPRGKEIRKAFIPSSSDHTILCADYSQVELRIIAALSNDTNMCDAFFHGEDIHASTAAKVFGIPLEKVDKTMRSKAKAVNFGIIYGQGAFGLAQNLGITRTEAKSIIDAYFHQFPALKTYQLKNIQQARETGYVQTLLGRRRYLPDIQSPNANVRGFAERNAINAPIQGTAADIIKIAMIQIHGEIRRLGLQSKMIMQVHDELVFDALKSELYLLQPLVRDKMMTAVQMHVPLEVDINTGDNWLEAH